MRCRSAVLLVALVLLPAAAAQEGASAAPTVDGQPTRSADLCQPSADDSGRLLVSLDPAVLDVLDRLDRSLFVHAYLVGLVAEPSAGNHWTSRCARAVLAVPLDSASALRDLQLRAERLPITTLIAELRAAGEQQAAQDALAERAQQGAAAVVAGLRQRLSLPEIAATAPVLRRLHETCADRSAWCRGLEAVTDTMSHLLQADARLSTDRQRLEQLSVCVAEAVEPLSSLSGLPPDSSGGPAPLAPVPPCLAFDHGRPDTPTSVADLQRAAESLRRAVEDRESALGARLRTLRVQLESLGEVAPPESSPAAEVPGFVTTGEVQLAWAQAVDLAPTVDSQAPPASTSIDLLGVFADLVLDRARDESVLYLITRLHGWMQADASGVLPAAFPETHRLFRSLQGLAAEDSLHDRLRVREAAQVPLSAWRAALADDYTTLPFQLASGSSPALCVRDTSGLCAQRLLGLQVALAGFRDLLRGASALDVVERLPRYAETAATSLSGSGSPPPPQWQAARGGLAMAAALAQAFRVQRSVVSTDPADYPYLLSPDALVAASAQHRSAFVRLLLLRAAPSLAQGAGDAAVSERGLVQGVEDATAALEQLAALLRAAPADPAGRARMTIQAVSAAVATSADLAVALRPALSEPLLALRVQWGQAGRVAEAVAAGDHGLALTRTITLLDLAAPGQMPAPVLRLSALASELAGAKTADQARAAFQAAASPLGGWEAKRFGDGARVTLTAYPGGGVWYESLLAASGAGGAAAGVSLSVGPEVTLWSRAASSTRCKVCSVGLFVPVLDLGALLNFRIDGGGTPQPGGPPIVSVEPNVSFAQVVSPGFYLSVGLGRSPAALLVGAQLSPQHRDLSVDGTTERASAIRFGGALTLDLVLLEF